jgi:excisionase family DNA binding protein
MPDRTVPRVMSLAAAASMLQVHPETLRRAIRAGKLTAYKVGRVARVSHDQIQSYLDASLCQDQDPMDLSSNGGKTGGTSQLGSEENVAAFRLERRMNALLDKR